MEKIVFNCETITPMFSAGADGTTPEIRVPEIKAAMRFWWRACNGHLSIKKLREKEAKIFGGHWKEKVIKDGKEVDEEKTCKSSFSMRINVINNEPEGKISLTPHHREGFCSESNEGKKCFYRKSRCMKSVEKPYSHHNFEVTITFYKKEMDEKITNVFKIASILGGLGKRSRRGFGCYKITDLNFNSVDELTLEVKRLRENLKESTEPGVTDKSFPFIENVQVGRAFNNFRDLLIGIGEASHKHGSNYPCYTGFVKKGRMASPLYLSVYRINDNYYPIITSLSCVFDPKSEHPHKSKDKRTEFTGELI